VFLKIIFLKRLPGGPTYTVLKNLGGGLFGGITHLELANGFLPLSKGSLVYKQAIITQDYLSFPRVFVGSPEFIKHCPCFDSSGFITSTPTCERYGMLH